MSELTLEEKKAINNFINIRDRLTVPTKEESSLKNTWQWKFINLDQKVKPDTIQKSVHKAASKVQVTPSQESASEDISDVNSSKQNGRK